MGLYFMIGFYSYTVVLTYLGLASAAMGMILTFQGFAKYALFCLAFSGLCDMFDGKVARLKKDRTEDEKRFGILTVGLLFIINFPLRKPGWKMLTLLVAIVSCALIKIYFF